MEVTGHLKLDNLLSEFTYLEEEFRFKAEEYEIGTTDGEYLFADVEVYVNASYDYEDNSMNIKDKSIDVVLHEDYFGMDKDGGELELTLSGDSVAKLEKLIKNSIEEKLT